MDYLSQRRAIEARIKGLVEAAICTLPFYK